MIDVRKELLERIWKRLDEEEFNHLHDVIVEFVDTDEYYLSTERVRIVFDMFPEYIIADILRWGLSDTEVRDKIYDFLKRNV